MPSKADRVWSEFIVALDAMAPDTRAAYLLHEVFEASYEEIARLIGEPAEICRAHVEYARAHALAHMQPLSDREKAPQK